MEVVLATQNDIPDIIPLQAQIYRVTSSPENATKILEDLIKSDNCDIFVAKDEGKVVGSGLIFYLNNPGHNQPFAFLEGIVVDDKVRGKGIGTKLSKFAIELAKGKNCYKILFTSGMDRSNIHQFYENLGFKVLEEISKTGKTVSELVNPYKKYFHSGEINFSVENKKKVLKTLGKK